MLDYSVFANEGSLTGPFMCCKELNIANCNHKCDGRVWYNGHQLCLISLKPDPQNNLFSSYLSIALCSRYNLSKISDFCLLLLHLGLSFSVLMSTNANVFLFHKSNLLYLE